MPHVVLKRKKHKANISYPKLIAYNSKIITEGNIIDDAIKSALAPKYIKDYYQCTPEFNPLTIEAQKTIAFEIFKDIGVPNWIIVPMGNGGCLVSIWKGFSELKESGCIENLPKLVRVQSELCAPIVEEFLHKEVGTLEETDILKVEAGAANDLTVSAFIEEIYTPT